MPRRKMAATSKRSSYEHVSSYSQQSDGAQAFSRTSAVDRYVQIRHKRSRRSGLKIFLIIFAVVLLAAGGVAAAYFAKISGALNRGVDSALRGQLTEAKAGDPFYMLLMGVDKSADREQSAEYGAEDAAYRTDSIILARIDPTNKKVTLVSIHRDTLVDFGANGKQKINAAYSIGAAMPNSSGPAYTIETVSKFAGVPISHYAEIDFDGFSSVIDQLGGIEVNVPIDIKDSYAEVDLKAGTQTLNGDQALGMCRARHAYDNYGDGDIYRAANQRMIIGAVVQKILASDPATISGSVSTLANYVTTDLSVPDILGFATQFSGFNPETSMYSGMEPTNSKFVNNTWYEICDTKAWQAMMKRVNQGLSPYSDSKQDATIGLAGGGLASVSNTADATASTADSSAQTEYGGSVQVLNGSGVSGLAGRIAASLSNQGFETKAATANRYNYTTTSIIYVGEQNKPKAQAVADTLGLSNVRADDGTYTGEADVVVVLGADMADK